MVKRKFAVLLLVLGLLGISIVAIYATTQVTREVELGTPRETITQTGLALPLNLTMQDAFTHKALNSPNEYWELVGNDLVTIWLAQGSGVGNWTTSQWYIRSNEALFIHAFSKTGHYYDAWYHFTAQTGAPMYRLEPRPEDFGCGDDGWYMTEVPIANIGYDTQTQVDSFGQEQKVPILWSLPILELTPRLDMSEVSVVMSMPNFVRMTALSAPPLLDEAFHGQMDTFVDYTNNLNIEVSIYSTATHAVYGEPMLSIAPNGATFKPSFLTIWFAINTTLIEKDYTFAYGYCEVKAEPEGYRVFYKVLNPIEWQKSLVFPIGIRPLPTNASIGIAVWLADLQSPMDSGGYGKAFVQCGGSVGICGISQPIGAPFTTTWKNGIVEPTRYVLCVRIVKGEVE